MEIKQIGIVGASNMGSMMGFAFSGFGLDVSIWDAESANCVQTFWLKLLRISARQENRRMAN
ncbi:hypothetical protein HDV62DRAFT_367951 [Trichoderma sp. SZMC 28011]